MLRAEGTGRRLAGWATGVATAATVALMTLAEHFRAVLQSKALEVYSYTMQVMAVLGEIVLVCVTVIIATIVAQLAFGQAADELRQQIALRRLIGSRRSAERRTLVLSCLRTGIVGAAVGFVVGIVLSWGATAALRAGSADWEQAPLPLVQPMSIIPAVGVAVGASLAAWLASRTVLGVAPLEALSASRVDADFGRRGGTRTGVVLLAVGAAVLGASAVLGLVSAFAVLGGVVGGAISVVGIVALATPVTSGMLRLIRRPLRATAVGRSAVGSLERAPHRLGGITVALMVGIASVTMFAVAGETAQRALLSVAQDADLYEYQRVALAEMTAQLMIVVSIAVACGSIVAVFGFVATMLMSVRARTREIGMMRLVGMRARQARHMVVVETAIIAALALVGGVLLGTLFGWLGTFMLLGSQPDSGAIIPAAPLPLLPCLLVATSVVALATALPAARRAAAIPPLAAVRD